MQCQLKEFPAIIYFTQGVERDKLARMSKLKWLTNAIGEQFVGFWALTYGGVLVALITSILLFIFATDGGVSWWISITFAVLAFWAVASGAFRINALLLKRKSQATAATNSTATLPRVDITNAANNTNTFNPHQAYNPSNVVNVNLLQEQPQRQPQSQSQSQQQETKPPVIEPVEIGTRIEKTTINRGSELQEKSDLSFQGDDLRQVDFAFAELYRGVDGSTEPFVDVRAHIEFFDRSGNLLFRIRDAHWRKATDKYASFHSGDSDEMLVAIVGIDSVWPYSGNYEIVDRIGYVEIKQFNTTTRRLDGKEFHVHIELIGVRGSRTILNQKFDYDLIAGPNPDFRLRKSVEINKARAHEELLPLLREGQELERKLVHLFSDRTRSLHFEYSTWSEQVERTLKLYLNDSFLARFLGNATDNWATDLHNKVIALEKIVRGLAD